jgi:hypothetical protein
MMKEDHVFATFFSVSAFASAIAVGVALPALALQLEVVYRRGRRRDALETPPVPSIETPLTTPGDPAPTGLVLSA